MHVKVNALHPCTLHYKAVRSRKETMRRWGGGTAAQGEATARHRPKLSAGPTKMGRRRIIEMEADTTAHRSRFEAMTGFEYNKKMNAKGHGVVVKRGEGGGRKLTSKNISYPCSAVPKRITGRGSGVFLSNIGTTASTADLRINASVERERERENGENNNGGDNNNNNGRCPGERVSNVSKLGPNSAVLPNCLCECEQRKHCKQIGATQASSNNNNHDEHASSSCKSLEALLAQSLLSPISIPSFPRVVHSNCPAEAEAAALKPHKMRISPHTRMPSSKSENKKNDSLLAPPQACVFSPPRWGLRHSTTGLEESHCKEKKNNDRYETNTNVKSIDHTLPTPHNACRMKRNENSVNKPLNPWHTPAEHNGSDKTSTSTATDVIATIEFNPSRQFVDKIALASRGKGVRRHYVTSTAAHKDRKQGATSLGLSRRKSLARRSSRVQLTKPSVGDVNNSSNRADLLLGPSSSSHTDLSRWNKLFDRKPTQRLLTSGHLFASVSKTGARVVRENTARRNRGDGTNKHPYPGTSCAAIDGDVGGATDFNNNHQLVSRSDPNNHLGLEMGLASAGCSSTFRKFRDSFLFVPSSAVEKSTGPSAAAPAATRTRQTDYPQNTTAAAFEWMNEGRNDCALAFDLVPPRELVGVLPSSSPFRLMTTTAHNKCGEINNTNNNHTNCGNYDYDYDYYGNPNIYNSKSGHKEGPLASTTACISGETIVPRPSLDHNDIPYGRLCHNPNLDLCPPLPREWPRSAWHDHRIGYPNQEEDSSVPYFSLPFNGRPPFNVSPAEGPRIDHQSIMATNAFHHHPYNNQHHHHHHYHENQKVSNDVIINDHHFSSPWSFGYGYSSYGGGDAAAAVDFQNVLRSPPPDLLHNSVSKNTMYVSRSANPTALLHPHSEEVWRSAGLTANSTVNPSNKGNRVCSHATAAQGGRPLQTTTTTTTTTFDPYAEMVSPFAFK